MGNTLGTIKKIDGFEAAEDRKSELTDLLCCVLTRGIPIDGQTTDTIVRVCAHNETVADLWAWVEEQTVGSAWTVRVEIVKAT